MPPSGRWKNWYGSDPVHQEENRHRSDPVHRKENGMGMRDCAVDKQEGKET